LIRNFVLVGHSYGGTIIAKVAEAISERIERLVFWDAFVLLDGQCLFDETPQNVAASEEGARRSGDDTYLPAFDMVRDVFFNSVDREDALRFYARWSPQPMQPFRDRLDLKTFYGLSIPKSFLLCTEDIRVPMPELSWHPRFSNRLGRFRFVSMPGDHEALFTDPPLLAKKLVEAGRPRSRRNHPCDKCSRFRILRQASPHGTRIFSVNPIRASRAWRWLGVTRFSLT
jgi:pimeloyl-ACP methyl ester carboxylesterase